MAPGAIRGLNAGWLLSSPGDIGIIGGASAFTSSLSPSPDAGAVQW